MKKSTVIFSAANLVGMVIIWHAVVSICQEAKLEHRDYYDAGDSFDFLATAMPVLFVCFLLDAGWGIKALVDVFRHKSYQAIVALSVFAFVWAIVVHRFVF